MDRMTWGDRTTIESQLAAELNRVDSSRTRRSGQTITDAQTNTLTEPVMARYSGTELYQLAYQRVEDELDSLRGEMRRLREKHKAAEAALDRRILHKEALRRKIIASATGTADQT